MRWKQTIRMVGWVLGMSPCFAELQVALVFSEGAVLQQGIPVPVWGIGEAGAMVTVCGNCVCGRKKPPM